MKRLIILPFAEIDIKDTIYYYKEISDTLEKDFIKILDLSFLEIMKNPDSFPKVKYDIRKFVVNKFPYCIFYVDDKEAIYVLAVFHDKRNPKDWVKRRKSIK